MSLTCLRCNTTFKREQDLKTHVTTHKKNGVPCDLFCNRCGVYYEEMRKYKNHEEKCKGKGDIKGGVAVVNSKNTIIGNTVNIGTINNNNNNNMNLAMNVKFDTPNNSVLSLRGMTPHGFEIKDLYRHHRDTLIDMIRRFLLDTIDRKIKISNITDEMMEVKVIEMIQLFYTNEQYPEHMNIMDNQTTCDSNQVFSGKYFVPDVMPKNIRNRYILQVLISILKKIHEENVCDDVKLFIKSKLIPHIIYYYFDDRYHQQLQNVWVKNCELLKGIDISKVRQFTDDKIGDYNYNEELEKQIEQYKKETSDLYVSKVTDEVEKCHSKLDAKRRNDLIDNNPVIQIANAQEEQAEAILQIEAPPLTEEQIREQQVERRRQEQMEAVRRSAGTSQHRDLAC